MFSAASKTAAVATAANYIEDVFSTYLTTGTGTSLVVNNGIDLAGKGGLVWQKTRGSVGYHTLFDTVRGVNKGLYTNTTDAQATNSNWLPAFNSNGFEIGSINNLYTNGETGVNWTFRKQPKFFDVVTYTGNGSTNRSISHSLGSTPGFIIVKAFSNADNWFVYHRSLGVNQFLVLEGSGAVQTGTGTWGNITSTTFGCGSDATRVNINGFQYVAYIFAHDAGGFGLTGTDNVITCGSFDIDGAGNATVNLGYEPQFVIIKSVEASSNWAVFDNMRGMPVTGTVARLFPNTSAAEGQATDYLVRPTATGFVATATGFTNPAFNGFIYIAIRRGPMKTPTTGTSVFSPNAYAGGTAGISFSLGFVPDMLLTMRRNTSNFDIVNTRLLGQDYGFTNTTGAYQGGVSGIPAWNATTNTISLSTATSVTGWNASGSDYVNEVFSRAPGFFDVVCYTGTGANSTVSHNLGVVPELMIVKSRNTANAWAVYANNDNTDYLVLNTDAATVDDNTYWNDTTPTASVFSIGTNNAVNASGSTYVAYLFATVAGVSKVGSYTGSGTTKQIDCGFTGGARFVLIKRTDSTGDWYVWDSARGIVSGNDPYLLLNSNAAEVTNTDYIDTYSAGFEISSTAPAAINANGGSFIFLAIA